MPANALERNLDFLHLGACGILLVLMMACSSPTPMSQPTTPAPTPSGMVDVGGHRLYYQCRGHGSPTVILEAGGPGDSTSWSRVTADIARTTRVCAYDRANLGKSDKGIPKPRTFQDMTRDLQALLENAHIGGPYILAGHSMGGMLVRVFADQHPEEVAGLVLVDSAHPDMGPRLLAGLPTESADEPENIKAWRLYLTWMSDSNGREQNDLEGVDLRVSNGQVKATKPLGDLPLVVISRSPDNPILAAGMPPLPAETIAKLRQIWGDLQSELAGLSSNSTRVIASQAGHFVQDEEPGLVVAAIVEAVNEARSRGEGAPEIASQAGATDHSPVIQRVVERKENRNGRLTIHEDIYFMDTAGDAASLLNELISVTPPNVNLTVEDDLIRASAAEQKQGALVTSSWSCGTAVPHVSLTVQDRILDEAGNLSEPVTVTVSCP